ncbi:MAG: hypothetical protein AB8B69_09005 [Chitinophagales bacterium]
MELITKIKASGINNLSDARYFSTFAEWIGFNFDAESSNYMALEKAKEIIGWLAGPRIVGEFDKQNIEYINAVCTALKIDSIQTDLDLNFSLLSPVVSTVMKRIVVDGFLDSSRLESILMANSGKVAYFILDFTQAPYSWEELQNHPHFSPTQLKEWCEDYPIVLHLPFTPENVLEIVEQVQPFALNMAGGTEDKVGLRAFDDIDPLVELLEIED